LIFLACLPAARAYFYYMKYVRAVFLISGLLLFSGISVSADTVKIRNGSNLQKALDLTSDGDTVLIGEGLYEADPSDFVDSLCGNCLEQQTEVSASFGFIVAGKSLHITGADRDRTILVTNAGYGLFFVNSPNSSITNLTITGGKRDPDGNATDAAIVVRNSTVLIHDLDINGNDHRLDSVVVGIGGIFGREGAEMTVRRCNITGNGWDGIALYRGASAEITDCLIKDGRGAGIGVTWDAVCLAYRNIITGYWKGIGAFGTSWVVARNNAVFDNLGWGMIATGNSFMDMANNVIYHNGNCGAAVWSTEARGRMVNNIITANGWKKEWVCPCVGVWNYGDWSKWEFSHNIVWNNSAGNYEAIWDQTDRNGNLSVNPDFAGESIFLLKKSSPAVDAGHPDISDPDGSRSDIGLTGGPQAKLR